MRKKRIISCILVFSMLISSISVNAADYGIKGLTFATKTQITPDNTIDTIGNISDKQKSSIAMLNYMTVLTQEINASANSKIYLVFVA